MADLIFIDESSVSAKKRRLPGSCDECRRRKVKCDSSTKPNGRCSNCTEYGIGCTHGMHAKKRAPKPPASPTSSYIKTLEQQVISLEAHLAKSKLTALDSYSLSPVPDQAPARDNTGTPPPYDPETSIVDDLSPHRGRRADDTRKTHLADDISFAQLQRSDILGDTSTFFPAPEAMNTRARSKHLVEQPQQSTSQSGWQLEPWERATVERNKPIYIFPPSDLIDHLLTIFFGTMPMYISYIHKASFLRDLQAGLHLTDASFGAVVLAVLANAARYSPDPRVFADYESEMSAGWQWFEQVSDIRSRMLDGPTLHDLQLCALVVMYTLGSSVPHTAGIMVAVGIRFAVEVGAHRRHPPGHKHTLEDELKKRTFWALLTFDRIIGLFLGQPSIIREVDFDLEFPVECDEEYWQESLDGELTFHQPRDKPSRAAFFRQELKLTEMMAYVSETIYSIKKCKVTSRPTGISWEQQIVSDLDSALNEWKDQLPDHLRWDPYCEDTTFSFQAATLIELSYLIQIQLHRPFIHSTSPLSFSSLAICTNAARACSHVLDLHTARFGFHCPYAMFGSFICGVVLSMNVWTGKRSGLALNVKAGVADVQKCLNVLKVGSSRWEVAHRMEDLLTVLSTLGDVDLSDKGASSLKRSWEVAELPEYTTTTTDAIAPHPGHFDDPINTSLARIFNEDATDLDFLPLGNDSVDMWSAAPTGFSWEEWGNFFAHSDVLSFDSTNVY